MPKASYLILVLLCLCAFNTNAQQIRDTTNPGKTIIVGDTVKLAKPAKVYDPKIASRRSAIFPGLGQIYNDSWWKVPILYAGFGVTVFFIDYNHDRFKLWEGQAKELIEKQQTTPLTAAEQNVLRQSRTQADTWRQNRDLLYITMVGIYALNIIEASIDAHLKGFNVDDNLALNLKPKLGVISNGAPYIGFGLTLKIGQ